MLETETRWGLFLSLLTSFLPHINLFPPSFFHFCLDLILPPFAASCPSLSSLFEPLLSQIFLASDSLITARSVALCWTKWLSLPLLSLQGSQKKQGKRQVFPLSPSKPSLPHRYQFPYIYTHIPRHTDSRWCVCVYHWLTCVYVYVSTQGLHVCVSELV